MQEIGHPIVGDTKYGARTNPYKRMMLHANKLELVHPITKETIHLETKMPTEFTKLIK